MLQKPVMLAVKSLKLMSTSVEEDCNQAAVSGQCCHFLTKSLVKTAHRPHLPLRAADKRSWWFCAGNRKRGNDGKFLPWRLWGSNTDAHSEKRGRCWPSHNTFQPLSHFRIYRAEVDCWNQTGENGKEFAHFCHNMLHKVDSWLHPNDMEHSFMHFVECWWFSDQVLCLS
jgi:hypothetical protein